MFSRINISQRYLQTRFFIKVIYLLNKSATIDLFSTGFESYITQIIIDKSKFTTTCQFRFENEDNHKA